MGSHKVADKNYIFTKSSLIASIGAIFTTTCRDFLGVGKGGFPPENGLAPLNYTSNGSMIKLIS